MMESVTPLPNEVADGARLEDRSKGRRALRPPSTARHKADEHAPPSISKHKKSACIDSVGACAPWISGFHTRLRELPQQRDLYCGSQECQVPQLGTKKAALRRHFS